MAACGPTDQSTDDHLHIEIRDDRAPQDPRAYLPWFAWFAEQGSASRRFAAFFIVAALMGVPAGALRILCVGSTCEVRAEATSNTPFCSLSDDVRRLVENGFYEGRSPDLMAVT